MDRIQAILDLLARADTAWPSHLAWTAHVLEQGEHFPEWAAGDARTRWCRRWRCTRCGRDWTTDGDAKPTTAAAIANRESCLVRIEYPRWEV